MSGAVLQGDSSHVVREGDQLCKTFRSKRGRRQSHTALTKWAAALLQLRAPTVLPPRPGDLPTMLRMTWLEGARLSESPGWRSRLDLAEQLGRGLAELHALPCDHDPMPLSEAVGRRMEGWLARDVGLEALGAGRRLRLRERLDPGALDGLVRVPCHRDVHGDNLLLAPDQPMALLDWEHAMADCAWVDLLRGWDGRPPDEDPWTAGVASAAGLPIEQWGALVALGLVEGAGCIVWGARNGQPDLMERGDTLLEHLLPG